jgi:putative effector of murein hydrolase
MVATPIFNRLGIRDFRARGLAIGVTAHGFGAARAFQVDPTAGAFASLGMALNAIITCVILSVVKLFL